MISTQTDVLSTDTNFMGFRRESPKEKIKTKTKTKYYHQHHHQLKCDVNLYCRYNFYLYDSIFLTALTTSHVKTVVTTCLKGINQNIHEVL